MTGTQNMRETSLAVIKRLRPDYVEAHYHHGVVINTSGLIEVQVARRELMGDDPYGMLSIIPHDVDFELAATNVDHLATDRKEGSLLAIAIVTHADMLEVVLKVYFTYFPQLSRIKVTTDEQEARAWLNGQLKELALAG